MRGLALTIRFLLELALLAAVAYGAAVALPAGVDVVAAILAPVVVAVVWGLLLSPKARFSSPPWARVLLELVLFGGAGAVLASVGQPLWGALLLGVWTLDRLALALLPAPDAGTAGLEGRRGAHPSH